MSTAMMASKHMQSLLPTRYKFLVVCEDPTLAGARTPLLCVASSMEEVVAGVSTACFRQPTPKLLVEYFDTDFWEYLPLADVDLLGSASTPEEQIKIKLRIARAQPVRDPFTMHRPIKCASLALQFAHSLALAFAPTRSRPLYRSRSRRVSPRVVAAAPALATPAPAAVSDSQAERRAGRAGRAAAPSQATATAALR